MPRLFERFARTLGGPSLLAGLLAAACANDSDAPPPAQGPEIVPTYNRDTGRLEQLTSDRNEDGRIDTWAYMDGRRLERIELDRDGNGVPDRIEYYETHGGANPTAPMGGAVMARAEESAGPDRPVTRREFYESGVLRRVEEDVDADGRVDKWEEHDNGRLAQLALDLGGRGYADRRLIYGPYGVRVEVDPDGDGRFEHAPMSEAPPSAGKEP